MDPSTADLVALHLAASPVTDAATAGEDTDDATTSDTDAAGTGPAPRAAAVPGIGEALSIGADAMADRIELLSALSTLKERGHVVERTGPVEGLAGERNVYRLTPAGRDRAREVRERLRDRRVTARDGDREWRMPLADADRYLDDPALVRACARLTEDGVLYLDAEEEDRFVDRRRPLGALYAALSATAAGEARAVLVAGEAGVGKTTLVSELLGTARDWGCRVLKGGCRRDASEPYQPFRSALADADLDDVDAPEDGEGDDLDPDDAAADLDLDPFGVDSDETDDADGTGDGPTPSDASPGNPFDRSGLDLVATAGDTEEYEALRRALFADVTATLERLATDRPLVLFVDDLHSADEATLELFAHVAESVADAPVLLVGTFRHEDLPEDHRLATLTETWARPPAAAALPDPHDDPLDAAVDPEVTPSRFAVDLSPFGREETATLVRRLLTGANPPESFLDALYEHTGGNPLFVTETVARLRETGAIDPTVDLYPTAAAELPVPDRVEEAVDVRLRTLDDRARRILAVGALVGETVPYDVLAAAVDVPEPELRDYVDVLVDSRVWERPVADGGERLDRRDPERAGDPGPTPTVAETDADAESGASRVPTAVPDVDVETPAEHAVDPGSPAGDGEWLRFSSGLVRETVVDRVAPGRARAIHARIATALADGDAASPGAVAHHYREADRPAEALAWYRRAAERAREVYAHEVAVEQYEHALELARELGDDERELAVLERLARVHRVLGDLDRANEYFDRVRRATDDDDIRVRIASYQSRMESRRGAYEEAIHHADRGLAILDGEDCSQRVRLLAHEGGAHCQRGEFEAARAVLTEAVSVAEDLDDDAALGRALHNLATLEMSQGGVDAAAIETMRRAVELREAAGDRSGVASSLNNLGGMYLRAGELAAAREAFQQCLALNEAMGDAYGTLKVRNNLGKVHQSRDEPDRAIECYERVTDEARRLGARQTLANALANAAGVHQEHRYDLDTAEEYLERSLSIQRDLDNTRWKVNTNLDLANVRATAGDLEAGLSHAERALSLTRTAEMDDHRCTAERYVGDIRNERGDHERALEHHERALELARSFEAYPDKEVLTRASLVDTLVHLDRVEAAREQATAAREAADQASETYDERYPERLAVYADVAAGTALRAAGEYDAAESLLADAHARARRLGMDQHAATTSYERARLAAARGDHDAAGRRLRETRETALELDFRLLAEKCETRLADLDAGSDSGRATDGGADDSR
jgi:tetratricopeptide (TPR) repeat protein/DNA-binding PadR family transcriptional regulator